MKTTDSGVTVTRESEDGLTRTVLTAWISTWFGGDGISVRQQQHCDSRPTRRHKWRSAAPDAMPITSDMVTEASDLLCERIRRLMGVEP